MTRLCARHQVEDYNPWRAVYDSINADRKKMGDTDAGVYRNARDGNEATIYHDYTSLEAAQAFQL